MKKRAMLWASFGAELPCLQSLPPISTGAGAQPMDIEKAGEVFHHSLFPPAS